MYIFRPEFCVLFSFGVILGVVRYGTLSAIKSQTQAEAT